MTGMTRWLAVAAAAAATGGTVAASSASAGDAPRATSPCQRLHGKDLAPAPKVKLVRRRNDDEGTDLRGCVLPRGRVRLLASSSNLETTFDGYRIRQVAGRVVLLATRSDSQYASARRLFVFDIRSGREYSVARFCSRVGGGSCDGPNSTAAAAFVNRRGQAAAAVIASGTDSTTIVGFSSRGERSQLDSGPSVELPPASLKLNGSTVSWTHSGEARTATLSG
jgi:hypothetical protein